MGRKWHRLKATFRHGLRSHLDYRPNVIERELETRICSPSSFTAISLLPIEILQQIFQQIITPFYVNAFQYECLYPSFDYNTCLVDSIDIAQYFLLKALQVCKAWNIIGTEILYSTPFLISHWRVCSFSRALDMNPSLGLLVKNIVVLLQGPYVYPLGSSTHQNHVLDIHARSALIQALQRCPNLLTLTTSNRSRTNLGIGPIDSELLSTSGISNNLRKLSIHGWPTHFSHCFRHIISKGVSLPELETLCLRDVFFTEDFEFPYLPKLRTLRIAQSILFNPSVRTPVLTLGQIVFPALSTLELFENKFMVDLDESAMARLSRYHCFEKPKFMAGHRNPAIHPQNLMHLAIPAHALHEQEKDTDWDSLRMLESLVLTVEPRHDMEVIRNLSARINLKANSRINMKQLTLLGNCNTPEQDMIIHDAAFVELRSLCGRQGVRFNADLHGLDDWITERLLAN